MKLKYTAIGLTVLVLAIAVFYGLNRRETAAGVATPSEVQDLFDTQRLPARRLSEDEGESTETRNSDPLPPGQGVGKPGNWDELQAQRAKLLGVNVPPRPSEIIHGGRFTYRALEEVFAIAAGEFEPAMGTVVERRNGFTLFRLEAGRELPTSALGVVYEARTGQLLVVTGQLTVHVKPSTQLGSLSSDYSLELVESIDRLSTAIFHGNRQSTSELAQLLAAMRKDERVVQADLELLGALRVAQ